MNTPTGLFRWAAHELEPLITELEAAIPSERSTPSPADAMAGRLAQLTREVSAAAMTSADAYRRMAATASAALPQLDRWLGKYDLNGDCEATEEWLERHEHCTDPQVPFVKEVAALRLQLAQLAHRHHP